MASATKRRTRAYGPGCLHVTVWRDPHDGSRPRARWAKGHPRTLVVEIGRRTTLYAQIGFWRAREGDLDLWVREMREMRWDAFDRARMSWGAEG